MIHKAFQTLGVNTMKNGKKKIKDDRAGNKGADENAPPTATAQAKGNYKYFPLYRAVLDFRTSCTREDAVAKMLGWMQGYIRYKHHEDETTLDNLIYVHSLPDSLEDHLLELRETAISDWSYAFDAEPTEDVLAEKSKVIFDCDELINKAGEYLCAIDDELAKGDSSALRIDQHTTKYSNEIHITLSSLAQWAKENHGITSLVTPESISSKEGLLDQLSTTSGDKPQKSKSGLSPTMASNLYVTFALLLNAYADKPKFSGDDKLNVSGMATHIAELATKHNGNKAMETQSYEAIKSRIEAAMAALKEMPPEP